MKQVIFNVGGALSTYAEFNDIKLIIDLGKSDKFNPVENFLYPLFCLRSNAKSMQQPTKFAVDQLVLSHPHNDHISSLPDFEKYFYPDLLTCPNDNVGMSETDKINWKLIEDNPSLATMKKMLDNRKPPLSVTNKNIEYLCYIPPKECEASAELCIESYTNNISIAMFLIINNHRIFLPGDLQKEGMDKLIQGDPTLKYLLKGGVDVLITPHHGLRSSFSTTLFDNMRNNKTRCLNIVSEKPSSDMGRQVDSRYSTADFCGAANNLEPANEPHYQVKTSRGHLFIDYRDTTQPCFEIINDDSELIKRFL